MDRLQESDMQRDAQLRQKIEEYSSKQDEMVHLRSQVLSLQVGRGPWLYCMHGVCVFCAVLWFCLHCTVIGVGKRTTESIQALV